MRDSLRIPLGACPGPVFPHPPPLPLPLPLPLAGAPSTCLSPSVTLQVSTRFLELPSEVNAPVLALPSKNLPLLGLCRAGLAAAPACLSRALPALPRFALR